MTTPTATLDLDALRTFVKVAELGSFTLAASQLGLTRARASTAVQQLESRLGTRLLHRTTRRVRPTPDGESCLERGRALLADADELAALFQSTPAALRGRVRIDMSNALARDVVIPRLPEFLAAHPLIEIELSTTDRLVDVVHEGFDCVLRVGTLADSGLVARRLGMLPQLNCASPAYLRAHGTPQTLADLAHHRLVHYTTTLGAPPSGWEVVEDGQRRFVPMAGVITVNSSDAYQAACVAGLGLVQAPPMRGRELIREGKLVEVMPQYRAAPMPVSLLYPNRRHLAKRVQALMDWLAGVLAPHLDPA